MLSTTKLKLELVLFKSITSTQIQKSKHASILSRIVVFFLLIFAWNHILQMPITLNLTKKPSSSLQTSLLPQCAAPVTPPYHQEQETIFSFYSQEITGNWRQQWNEIRCTHGIYSTGQWQAATSAVKYSDILAWFLMKIRVIWSSVCPILTPIELVSQFLPNVAEA